MGTSNVTLYAKWTVNTYTVTYNSNGHTAGSVPASQTQDYNTTVTVRANTGNLARIPAAGTAEAYKFGGWRYLEAAPQSTEWTSKVWGGFGTPVTGADGTAIGTGKQNTLDIVTQFGGAEPYQSKTDYAAKLCNDLVYGGYSDWFLPSRDELNQMSDKTWSFLNGMSP